MRRRAVIVGGALLAVVVLLVGAVVLWWLVLRDDAPPPADIERAGEVLETTTTTADAATAPAPTDEEPAPPDDGTAAFDGRWTVDPTIGSFDDFSSSWAGYRIDEELEPLGANTAVGRTPDVTGSIVIDGLTVTDASIEVDMTTLRSDDSRRDGQLRSRGLETDDFPTATFVLTEPIVLDALPAEGETASVEAVGDLTLHGVTREVRVALDARPTGEAIAVVGSTDVILTDHDIEPPTGLRVLSVADVGILELQLFFSRA